MSHSSKIAGRFVIADLTRDLLGRSGMGDVYRATDTQTGETVAVKALNLHGQTSEVLKTSEVFDSRECGLIGRQDPRAQQAMIMIAASISTSVTGRTTSATWPSCAPSSVIAHSRPPGQRGRR